MGGFVRSPLGARDAGVSNRAAYIIARGTNFDNNNPRLVSQDETLFRLSLDDLATPLFERRPPWWPAPHPIKGQEWHGDVISGDASTVWYSAVNSVDINDADSEFPRVMDQRWTIDIYKLDGQLGFVKSWRWHQPQLGGGTAWHIAPFGNSTALWGLASVHESPEAAGVVAPQESYLVELDPDTMQIRRTSPDLWEGLNTTERLQRRYVLSGGGDSSVIWLARSFVEDPLQPGLVRTQILEYSPADFSLVRITEGPRNTAPDILDQDLKRQIYSVGGDSQSIWILASWVDTVEETRISRRLASELPRDFSNENRTIVQDEVQPPLLTTTEFAFTADIVRQTG
ncbi:hypothetical protein LCGC14_2061290 [marine sediment metagenome]|uniref:Uncharacterized protein n=1 Tax=marine sediment metagenome TaxID=412755 RepID=A0A0F9HI11_9ZZZZ